MIDELTKENERMRGVLQGILDRVDQLKQRRESPGGQQAGSPEWCMMQPSIERALRNACRFGLGLDK